jgi:anti-sigma-K factor RskA
VSVHGYEHDDQELGARCERGPDAAAYVLGALDAHEVAPFREHLQDCAICQGEVTQLQKTADALALGVSYKPAPDALRARIMATVHSESELLKAAGHEADRVRPPAPRWRRGLLPALAAAAALGVGLLIGALAINTGSSTQHTLVLHAGTEHAQVLQASVELPGHHNASAELRRVGSHLELVVVGMPAPPPGHIYEIWLVPPHSQTPLPTDALFSVTHQGDGSVGVPGSAQNVSEVLVTAEPLGGSLKPTRKPVIVAPI